MKKDILIALGMAAVFFLYGYAVTNLGHNHDEHGRLTAGQVEGHSGHDHHH